MGATSCSLVAFISRVLHDFDTYGLDSAYSSLSHFLYMLYLSFMDDICEVTTRCCGFASNMYYDMVVAFHFIFLVLA